MLKILTIIAPFVLKGAAKNPAKSLAGQFGFYVLFLPLAASATALTIGMLLSREYFD